MDAIIVYHSITGNTEKAAKSLAKGLKRAGASVAVKKVGEAEPSCLRKYHLVCIGTPVHYFKPSRKVKEFLERIPDLTGKFGVAFSTHGGLGPGRSLSAIEGALRGRGARILGSLTTVAANYHYKLFVLHGGRPNEDDLRKFEEFGENVTKTTLQR